MASRQRSSPARTSQSPTGSPSFRGGSPRGGSGQLPGRFIPPSAQSPAREQFRGRDPSPQRGQFRGNNPSPVQSAGAGFAGGLAGGLVGGLVGGALIGAAAGGYGGVYGYPYYGSSYYGSPYYGGGYYGSGYYGGGYRIPSPFRAPSPYRRWPRPYPVSPIVVQPTIPYVQPQTVIVESPVAYDTTPTVVTTPVYQPIPPRRGPSLADLVNVLTANQVLDVSNIDVYGNGAQIISTVVSTNGGRRGIPGIPVVSNNSRTYIQALEEIYGPAIWDTYGAEFQRLRATYPNW